MPMQGGRGRPLEKSLVTMVGADTSHRKEEDLAQQANFPRRLEMRSAKRQKQRGEAVPTGGEVTRSYLSYYLIKTKIGSPR